MPSEPSGGGDLHARRLDLAGTRDFTVAGAGDLDERQFALDVRPQFREIGDAVGLAIKRLQQRPRDQRRPTDTLDVGRPLR